MLCFCMPHIANHTHKKSPVFYLFEAVFMKRTPVFSGKGFAFHILCELSQEYIFNKAKILRKCFLFIFLGHLFLCSPHWVHHQTELFLCHFSSCCFHVPADYKSSSTKPLFHTEHISSSATNWNSHMVFISKPCTRFVSWKHFFYFLSVRWAATRCTQALLMSWLMRTSIRKMHSWSMMASRGSGPLRIVGRLGASSTGRRPPTFTAGTMAAQTQFNVC